MNEISIHIFWGPWDGELNPLPIVSVGNLVGSIVPSAPVLVKEDKSWMIKTDDSKSVFACYSKERCFNSDSYMQLLVCVIIPKGKRLEGEKSPLDLLEDVRNQFDQLFTIDIDAALSPKEEVDAAFAQVLSNYVVVDCPWYVFDMEGKDPAAFQVDSRSQLNALMRFNAYPALAHVEHLELGFKCKTTVEINTKGNSNGNKMKENKGKRGWRKQKVGNETTTNGVEKVAFVVEEPDGVENIVQTNGIDEISKQEFGETLLGAERNRLNPENGSQDVIDANEKDKKNIGKIVENIILYTLVVLTLPFDLIYRLFKRYFAKPGLVMAVVGLLVAVGFTAFFGIKSLRVSNAYKKCKTMSDYVAFLEKYPNSKYSDAASFHACSQISQYRHYLVNYPEGAFRHEADSIVEAYVRDSVARFDKAEQEAYQKCNDNDLLDAYNACMDYLANSAYVKHRDEVDSLKNAKQKIYYQNDYEAYQKCLNTRYGCYSRLNKCNSYVDKFKYGKYLSEVMDLRDVLKKESDLRRADLLEALNSGYYTKKRKFLGEGYLSEEENRAAIWLERGGSVYDTDFQFDYYYRYDWDKQINPIVQSKVDTLIMKYVVEKEGKEKNFRFENWSEVYEIYKEAKNIANSTNKVMAQEKFLEFVNGQDLIGAREAYYKFGKGWQQNDFRATEWILDYPRLIRTRLKHGGNPVEYHEVEMRIRHYLEDELDFPRTPFKNMDEVRMAKKHIDEIIQHEMEKE